MTRTLVRREMRGRKVVGTVLRVGLLAFLVVTGFGWGITRSVSFAASTSFAFTAVGDYGGSADANTTATLKGIGQSGANFNLALGDLGYGEMRPESAW